MRRGVVALLGVATACSSPSVRVGVGDDGPASSVMDGAAANSPDGGSQEAAPSDVFGLCDGTQRLRLWAFVEPGNELRGSLVRVENGSPFFAVDGLCSYWTSVWTEDAQRRDREIRGGVLTASDVATLEQGVALGDISSLRDCGGAAGLFDYSVRAVSTPTATAECGFEGKRFDAAWSVIQTVAESLWARGIAMDGALHVSAVVSAYDPSSGSAMAYAWPLAMPLSDFLLDPGIDGINLIMPGTSKLVSDPDSPSRLRALRERYLADRDAQPGLYANWDGLKTTDGVSVAVLYMRDAIPYEDQRGLLQF